MTDINAVFNMNGKISTQEEFWVANKDKFIGKMGITQGFYTMLGEQVFKPIKDPQIRFYKAFAGERAINAGVGWKENLLNEGDTFKLNPKATAQDDLGFVDSTGLEKTFEVDVAGRKTVSIPSSLYSVEEMVEKGMVGMLNSLLVDNMMKGYQKEMESLIGMKAVSTTKAELTVDANKPLDVLKLINKTAIEMRGTKIHYNDLTTEQNKKLDTHSDKVLCFMSEDLVRRIRESFADLPSPDNLGFGCEIIPLVDGVPKPLTTAEFNKGVEVGGDKITTWTPSSKPVAVDKPEPIAFMCSADRVEYRPLIGGYRMNISRNGAGDFANQHLIWRGAVAVRPWENAVRINNVIV